MTDTQKRKRARPTIYGEPMVKLGLLVRKDQRQWINENGGSAKVRALIDEARTQKLTSTAESLYKALGEDASLGEREEAIDAIYAWLASGDTYALDQCSLDDLVQQYREYYGMDDEK